MSALETRRKEGKPRPPDRRTAWREVAGLVPRAELVEGKRAADDKVLVRHGPWRVWLDTYTVSTGNSHVTYTRIRAYFRGWRELTLKVRRRNVFDRLWEALGFGRRLPVAPALTERFVVKGKPEARVPSLFSGAGLTEALLALPTLHLYVKRPSRKSRKRFGEDAGVVVCQTTGVVRDVARLVGMIRVVCQALEALERVGEARAEEIPDA